MFEVAQALLVAGAYLPLAVITNQLDIAASLKVLSPQTIIVGRVRGAGNEPCPYDASGQWMDGGAWLDHWFPYPVPGVDYFQCENEVFDSSHVQGWRTFYLQMIARANVRGVHVTVGNFSVASYAETDVIALADVWRAARAGSHAVVDHAYLVHGSDPTEEPEHTLRWKWITDRWPGIQVLIGEYGKFPKFPGVETWLQMVAAYDAMLRGTGVKFAGYTLTTPAGGWQGFDFSAALPGLIAWWQKGVIK